MKNRIFSGCILVIIYVVYYVFTVYNLALNCVFRKYFGIQCPACGMTRAFKSILSFNFKEAIKYNILSIPLIIIVFYFIIKLIMDLLTGKNYFVSGLKNFLNNYYIIIIAALIISFIYNNIVR